MVLFDVLDKYGTTGKSWNTVTMNSVIKPLIGFDLRLTAHQVGVLLGSNPPIIFNWIFLAFLEVLLRSNLPFILNRLFLAFLGNV